MLSQRPHILPLLVALACLSAPLGLCAEGKAPPPPPEVRGTKMAGTYHGPVEIWATPSHKQAAGRFRHGLADGLWTFWDSGGTKIVEFNYRADSFSGAVKMYFSTDDGPRLRGKIKFRGSFLDGEWEGSVMSYYPDGRNRSERVYRNGVIAEAYAQNTRGQRMSPEAAMEVAVQDEEIDNNYVDALDEYIHRWVN